MKLRTILPFFLAAGLLAVLATPARAGNVTTYAGGGANPGDNIPATSAQIGAPQGVAVDSADNVYFASNTQRKVRKVTAATGLITTIAGTGVSGDSGDGGPAVNARFNSPLALALDAAGNIYVVDGGASRVRKINAADGTISTVAGTGISGFSGDGGPATAAQLRFPEGVAVAPNGDVYICDTINYDLRKVSAATGIITTVAGDHGNSGVSSGDGGPAIDASFTYPSRVKTDSAGHVYILDYGYTTTRVRRIHATTGIITTVATGINFGEATDLALDGSGHIYVSATGRVWKVTLATNSVAMFAGTGTTGFLGDGGDPLLARFGYMAGLAAGLEGDVFISDTGNARVRKVEGDFLVGALTPQAALDLLTALDGGLAMVGVNGRTLLSLPNLTALGGGLDIRNNPDLTGLSLPLLDRVGGAVNIANNPNLTEINLTSVTDVDGGIELLTGNSGTVIVGAPTVSEDVVLETGNFGAVSVGDATVEGDLVLQTGNSGTVNVGAPTVSGDLILQTGNSGFASVGALAVDGNLILETGNSGTLSVGDPTVGGEVILDTGNSGTVSVGAPNVTGDLTVTTGSQPTLNLSGATVGDDTQITTNGAGTVMAKTGGGASDVTMANGAATMNAKLPAGVFAAPVVYSIQHQTAPAASAGLGASGGPALIGPLAAYQFTFAIPSLNSPATLSFEIVLATLTPADRAALLTALAAGTVTLATQGDAPGASY